MNKKIKKLSLKEDLKDYYRDLTMSETYERKLEDILKTEKWKLANAREIVSSSTKLGDPEEKIEKWRKKVHTIEIEIERLSSQLLKSIGQRKELIRKGEGIESLIEIGVTDLLIIAAEEKDFENDYA